MFTATLYLPSEKKYDIVFSKQFQKLRKRFCSKISIEHGDSKQLDFLNDNQLNDFVRSSNHILRIVIDGKDEMKAASELVDFFNHGAGI